SIIFIATKDKDSDQVVGFARLIPGYCSLELTKYWVLYDLYTDENHRYEGVATDLLSAVKTFATEDGASRVDLQTAHTNLAAQKLYEKNGYKQDEEFCTYTLVLPRKINECNLDQEKTTRISMKK
ncbi:MAG: GNAT family N-acetyltransferase, partial [Proteobacteria bacterium]|nr:GNAT family N-acetyltransferase [Pseudomonadota bacterium]